MRWVFIRPRNQSPYYDPEIQEPLGLECLAASRRARGDQTLLLDPVLDNIDETKLGRRAAAFQPDFVGFSLTTAQELDSFQEIFTQCRLSLNERHATWLAGGNFISTESSRALSMLPKEFLLVPYEGENALQEIATHHEHNSNGPAGSDARQRIHAGRSVQDLDAEPFPLRPYAGHIRQAGWAFSLQGSRGCCGCCRFCASPGMTADGVNRWRGRSPHSMVEEMAQLQRRFGASSFNIIDEDFLGPPALAQRRASQMAESIRKRNLRLSFGIQVRPGSLSDTVIDDLTAVGLTYVFVGIESDNGDDLRRWGRPQIEDPWRLVQRLRTSGAEVNAGVMLFHSHATLAGIRRFAGKLHEHRLLEFRSATNRLDAMPGSTYYDDALANGEIDPQLAGPQPLPFRDPDVEKWREELLLALEPLGPPSMHAACALPPLLAQRFLDHRLDSTVHRLQDIINDLDNTVARSLFQLLDQHQHGVGPAGLVASLRRENLAAAIEASATLAREGFAPSYDTLREAIRIDAGM